MTRLSVFNDVVLLIKFIGIAVVSFVVVVVNGLKQKVKNDEIRGVIRDVNELRTEMREIKDLLIGLTNGR